MAMDAKAKIIPIKFVLLTFSLNRNAATIELKIIMPILFTANTNELSRVSILKAFIK